MKPTRERVLLASTVSLILILFFGAWGRVLTGPPRKITFAAGSRNGAYYRYAESYRDILAQSGLEVTILETKGSIENLKLLESGEADIGFVQSGLKGKDSNELRSLGSVFYEPVWVFFRGEGSDQELLGLEGKTVAIGYPDSGTREIALTLLADNRLTGKVKTLELGGAEANEKLLNREIDAVVIVGSSSIPEVKELAHRESITLMNFYRAKAYSRYHDSLNAVTLFQGMLNLAQDIPAKDTDLIASSANLVVGDKFHYALVILVLQTARKVHHPAGPFHQYDEFPSPRMTTFPLVPEADSFYRRGPSFFYRNLPFYLAATLDRLIIILIPLFTLLLPLGRILPPLFGWVLNRKIYRKQTMLAEIEMNEANLALEDRLAKLQELEDQIVDIKTLPPAYQNEIFLLQLRIERVREKLTAI